MHSLLCDIVSELYERLWDIRFQLVESYTHINAKKDMRSSHKQHLSMITYTTYTASRTDITIQSSS